MSSHKRVPAGVPAGGQFAPSTHSEADIGLDDGSPQNEDSLDLQTHLDQPGSWGRSSTEADTAAMLAQDLGISGFTDDVGVRWHSETPYVWSADEHGSRIRLHKSFNDGGYKWSVERDLPKPRTRGTRPVLKRAEAALSAREALTQLRLADAELRRATHDTSGWSMTQKQKDTTP